MAHGTIEAIGLASDALLKRFPMVTWALLYRYVHQTSIHKHYWLLFTEAANQLRNTEQQYFYVCGTDSVKSRFSGHSHIDQGFSNASMVFINVKVGSQHFCQSQNISKGFYGQLCFKKAVYCWSNNSTVPRGKTLMPGTIKVLRETTILVKHTIHRWDKMCWICSIQQW